MSRTLTVLSLPAFLIFSGCHNQTTHQTPSKAEVTGFERSSEWLWSESVQFLEYHDRMQIYLEDGRKFQVALDQPNSDGPKWSEVNQWQRGRSLRISFSQASGPILIDVESLSRLPIIGGFDSAQSPHPLDRLLRQNLENSRDTASIEETYALNTQRWETEIDRIYDYAAGLTLPTEVGGLLQLKGLTSVVGLNLPEAVNRLDLNGLNSAEGLKFPKKIQLLRLNGLRSVMGLKLPEDVGCLILNGLTSADGLNLPQKVEMMISLNGLTSAKGLTLPDNFGGKLYLNGLTSAIDLQLTDTVKGLHLDSLSSTNGLILPKNFSGWLNLDGLKRAKELNLPDNYLGGLSLNGLTSAVGLKLPHNFN